MYIKLLKLSQFWLYVFYGLFVGFRISLTDSRDENDSLVTLVTLFKSVYLNINPFLSAVNITIKLIITHLLRRIVNYILYLTTSFTCPLEYSINVHFSGPHHPHQSPHVLSRQSAVVH